MKTKLKKPLVILVVIISIVSIVLGIHRYADIAFLTKYESQLSDVVINGQNSYKNLDDLKRLAKDFDNDNFEPYNNAIFEYAFKNANNFTNRYSIHSDFRVVNDKTSYAIVTQEYIDGEQSKGRIYFYKDTETEIIEFYRTLKDDKTEVVITNGEIATLSNQSKFIDLSDLLTQIRTLTPTSMPTTTYRSLFNVVESTKTSLAYQDTKISVVFTGGELTDITCSPSADITGYSITMLNIINAYYHTDYRIDVDDSMIHEFKDLNSVHLVP